MASVMVHGVLLREAVMRESKNGNRFGTAVLREGSGEGAVWWNVVVFDEGLVSELMGMRAGETFGVMGTLKSELYEKDGKARVSLGVTASRMISHRKQPGAASRKPAPEAARGGGLDFNDDIPF